MALLADYAITPDVFDVTAYPTEGECAARLETIREAMLTEGLVRDLRDGAWTVSSVATRGHGTGGVRNCSRRWPRRGGCCALGRPWPGGPPTMSTGARKLSRRTICGRSTVA